MNTSLKGLVLTGLALLSSTLLSAATLKFQTNNGHWLCAEGGGGQNINATRTGAGPWETFILGDLNGGALESGDVITLQAPNALYLCAENGGGIHVVANRYGGGPWEQFTITKQYGSGQIVTGDAVAIRVNNGQYWCAEGGGGQILVANRNGAGSWETFTVVVDDTYTPPVTPNHPPVGRANLGPLPPPGWDTTTVNSYATDEDDGVILHWVYFDNILVDFRSYSSGVRSSSIGGWVTISSPGWHYIDGGVKDASGVITYFSYSEYIWP